MSRTTKAPRTDLVRAAGTAVLARTRDGEHVPDYEAILAAVVDLLESARRASARAVNVVMTATYWEVGRRIVEFEQGGAERAEYAGGLLKRLSRDLTKKFGRGFSVDNLENMRRFYFAFPRDEISETVSRNLPAPNSETASRISRGRFQAAKRPTPSGILPNARRFPLPWSHYVKLLSVEKPEARKFYEAEALRGGWSVRQLDRQIATLFYERTALSRNKSGMLEKGGKAKPADAVAPEEEIKDPYVLEFLGLKDE